MHVNRNRVFQPPMMDRSSGFLSATKYAASPIYAPIHSEKAILLKDVSFNPQRTVLTTTHPSHTNGGGDHSNEYSFLPTTLVLSEINDTYTTLGGASQRKQSTGNQQSLEFNEI